MIKLIRILLRITTACLFVGVALAGCSKDRDHHDHPNLTTGEALYKYHCAECHAEDGTGRLVDRTPANILTTKDMQGIMNYIISNTGQGRKMPVFATMPRSEAAKIAAYLIELQNKYNNEGENHRKNRELLIKPE
jgi:mono/diheme cytochrome c family protein